MREARAFDLVRFGAAQIRRHRTAAGVVLGKGTFSVTVFPNVDYVFISALAVMLQEIHLARRRNS